MAAAFVMEKENVSISEQYSFWLRNQTKVLSFHPETGYEKIVFMDHKSMWKKVHELVEQGFRVH